MTTDKEFLATGPAQSGFATDGAQIDIGARLNGKSFGALVTGEAIGVSIPFGGGDGLVVGAVARCGVKVVGAGETGVQARGSQVGIRGIGPDSEGFMGGNDPVFGQHTGVYGESDQLGVFGHGIQGGTGVYGLAKDSGVGIRAETLEGLAFRAHSFGKGRAAEFVGDVHMQGHLTVTGDIYLPNADCAEEFEVDDGNAVAGSVMVIGQDGRLSVCQTGYDNRVVGVVSGAGSYKPAITLDSRRAQGSRASGTRAAIALVGKVFCLVDATQTSVLPGDLLTSSDTLGHAMKATDPLRRAGAVIGKALGSLTHGRGLVPMLVMLR